MNAKAEKFQAYLKNAKLQDFTPEEIVDDPLEAVVFRSHLALEDTSIYGIIRILVMSEATAHTRATTLGKQMNAYNQKYKAFKYYLDGEGNLVLDVSLLCRGDESDGDMVYAMFRTLDTHLQEAYPVWKKLCKK